jgi:PAS domain S-box-containing protein
MDYFVFVVLAPLGAAVLLAAFLRVWPHRHVPPARPLLATGATIAGWLLFNTAEALAVSPEAKLLWAKLTYLFIATAPLAWLTFALAYTNRTAWLEWRWLLMLAAIPILTNVLVLTNDFHGLIWRSYSFYEIQAPAFGPFPDSFLGMQVIHGAGYWLFAAYSYACLMVSSGLIILEHLRSFAIYRRQSMWMVAAVLAPLAANFIYLTGSVPGMNKDFAPIAYALGAGIFAIVVSRYGLLDLKPFARNLLIEKMRDGMLVLDERNRIVDFNAEAATTFALDGNTVIGRHLISVLSPEHGTLAGYLEGVREEKAEISLVSNAGVQYYEVRITPLADSKGQVTGRLLVLYDVTQRKEHEAVLRQTNLKLESECEELDAFAHTVAHDLKNPVHTILGFCEILEEDYDSLPEELRRDAIQTITRTTHKMYQIIRELLLLASVRRHPVEIAPVDMTAVVTEVLERLRMEVENRKASITAPDMWPVVLGYGPWVEEVWSNYVGNALKYAGSEPHLELGYTLDNGTAHFYVRDFGPGVPPHKQAQLFVPFSRVGQLPVDGHGLGLSIVRRIMETLGGGFGVESTGIAGEGSTFYFTLPLTTDRTALAITNEEEQGCLST